MNNRNTIIKLNFFALGAWYLLIPLSVKITFFKIGGTTYDASRILGLVIIFGNTLLLPFINFRRIPFVLTITALLFLFYTALHIFLDANIPESLNVFVRIYSGFILLFIFCGTGNEEKKRLIEQFIIFMGVYTAIYVITQLILYKLSPSGAVTIFGKDAYWGSPSGIRPQGPLLSAGGSSSVMALSSIVLLIQVIKKELKPHLILLGVILFTGLLINFTRTYLLSLTCMFVVCLALYKKYKQLTYSLMLAAAIFAGSTLFVNPLYYLERIQDIPGLSSKAVSEDQLMQGRGSLIKIVWNDFTKKEMERMLLGDGLTYASKVIVKYYHASGEASTHNDFLWLLSDLGVIGLLSYLGFYAAAFLSYTGEYKAIYYFYLVGIMLASGVGGETITITGHRFLQMIFLAYFLSEKKKVIKADSAMPYLYNNNWSPYSFQNKTLLGALPAERA